MRIPQTGRNMNTRIITIIAFLCFLPSIYAQETSEGKFKVKSTTADLVKIEVFDDCDIIVAEIAPKGKKIIYGDNVNGTQYGGSEQSRFKENQIEPNISSKSIINIRQIKKRVVLSVNYSGLTEAKIKIKTAEYKTEVRYPGYYPSEKTFEIQLIKGKRERNVEANTRNSYGTTIPDGTTLNNTLNIQIINDSLKSLSQDIDKLKNETPYKKAYGLSTLLIVLLIGLLVVYYLLKKDREKLKTLSKEHGNLKKIVEEWEKKYIETGAYQTSPKENKKGTTMSDEDVKKFIVEQINSVLSPSNSSINKPSTLSASTTSATTLSTSKEKQLTDTDDVKYYQNDNSFSIEQTNIKIFRIYSRKGEFYYTIVNDTSVREELIGMLQTFEGCITYQTFNGEAKRVEPVKDGKLRKEGNKFYVDANNKLVVKFA